MPLVALELLILITSEPIPITLPEVGVENVKLWDENDEEFAAVFLKLIREEVKNILCDSCAFARPILNSPWVTNDELLSILKSTPTPVYYLFLLQKLKIFVGKLCQRTLI